jgi:two-component sensor histidine kinase/DNA-binding response OmpR family regulator
MASDDKINILLVDDQPAKLLTYEAILEQLGENLIKANSAKEAFEQLLKTEIAIVLVDVCMPDLDGFQLAAMVREHPRFQKTAIIFVSAVLLADVDHLRGYEIGAVDYVPVPVIPEVLRAKVRVFAELYRKTRQLETLNRELEQRVAERTAELEASTTRLLESEQRRSVALAAGQMGSWDWDVVTGKCIWDDGQYRIFGVEPGAFALTFENIRSFIHPDDLQRIQELMCNDGLGDKQTFQTEARIIRPNGETRWCICAAALTADAEGRIVRVSGVSIDISDRKEAEDRQALLAREVDHRARNTLAVVQAIVRLTHASTTPAYVAAVEGRIRALAQTHNLLSKSYWQGADLGQLVAEELAPYRTGSGGKVRASGPAVFLPPDTAQTIALALHELATNAAKYGALSSRSGEVTVTWKLEPGNLALKWSEAGGPPVTAPLSQGFGTKIINGSIKRQIGGKVAFDWRPQGLVCQLSLPYGAKDRARIGPAGRDEGNLVQLKYGAARRLLLVEDEVLVGMMMRDVLTDLGFFVAGPFCTVAEASSAASSAGFDCAILDVNLGGEPVYPVADLLRDRKVPFIFVTGYDDKGLDPHYANAPVLQKPIDQATLKNMLGSMVNGPSAPHVATPEAAEPRDSARMA